VAGIYPSQLFQRMWALNFLCLSTQKGGHYKPYQ